MGLRPKTPRSSDATSASIGLTLRYATGSPLRCGAPSSPQGPRAGARRANHHPCLALVAPMSHCFACSLALLLSLPKELSLFPPPAALQFLAPQRRGTMVRVDKHFLVYFPCFRQIYLPHPLTATHCRPRFFRKASPRLAAGTWGIFQPSRPFSSSASAFSTAMRPSRSVFTCVLWNGVTAPSSARSR